MEHKQIFKARNSVFVFDVCCETEKTEPNRMLRIIPKCQENVNNVFNAMILWLKGYPKNMRIYIKGLQAQLDQKEALKLQFSKVAGLKTFF